MFRVSITDRQCRLVVVVGWPVWRTLMLYSSIAGNKHIWELRRPLRCIASGMCARWCPYLTHKRGKWPVLILPIEAQCTNNQNITTDQNISHDLCDVAKFDFDNWDSAMEHLRWVGYMGFERLWRWLKFPRLHNSKPPSPLNPFAIRYHRTFYINPENSVFYPHSALWRIPFLSESCPSDRRQNVIKTGNWRMSGPRFLFTYSAHSSISCFYTR